MPDARLLIDGRAYSGWSEARIERGIDRLAGAFELVVSNRWKDRDTATAIRPGAACALMLDGDKAITGYVDEVIIEYNDAQHQVTIRGRDRAGDLVDCSAPLRQWSGRTLSGVAQELCEPFGIAVTDNVGDETPFRRLKTEPGETVFELLERAARLRGLLLVSDGNGAIEITRTGKTRAPTALELGKNILSVAASYSHAGRFSETRVLGQQPGGDFLFGENAAQVLGTANDPRITRHRPTLLVAEDPIDAQAAATRARWQSSVAYGRSMTVQVTVAGWRHAEGLWEPNRRVLVRDDFLGLDAWLLVVGVAHVLDRNGSRTELTLMPPEAFEPEPLPEKEVSDGWAA